MPVTMGDLIGAKLKAIGEDELAGTVKMAHAYYHARPYPQYPSRSHWWDAEAKESRHPRVVLPVAKLIVDIGCDFLFKRAPVLRASEEDIQEPIERIWDANELSSKLFALAQQGGIEGAVVLKFSKDVGDPRRYPISFLSPLHARFYWDPDDVDRLMMVRVQYCRERTDGVWAWYREEWTAEEYVEYEELPATVLDVEGEQWLSRTNRDLMAAKDRTLRRQIWDQVMKPFARGGQLNDAAAPGERPLQVPEPTGSPWRPARRSQNPFGVIPFVMIRNIREYGTPVGQGDFWDLLGSAASGAGLLDKVNLTASLLDLGNQASADPSWFFKNVQNEDLPTRILPGGVYSLAGLNADVLKPETGAAGMQRPMQEFLAKLETLAYQAASVSNIDTSQVTGLGQMSGYALSLLYAPLVALANRKRPNYGQDGLGKFFGLLAAGAARSGDRDFEAVEPGDPATWQVKVEWGPHFAMTPLDRQMELANLKAAADLGMPLKYLVKELAKLYGFEEPEEFEREAQADAEMRGVLSDLRSMAQEALARSGIQPPPRPEGVMTAADGGLKMSGRMALGEGVGGG
ncbi:MAG: hypothetical protein A2V88_17635 [Elusimicrobia bacterium RBG_16_66_12]|nr:MAG: hypothetical protein A2V88_17635 [Elusimicrobia bacterium RBG_16_66_12]